MLRNRTIQMTFPKKPVTTEPNEPSPYADPEITIPMIKDLAMDGAKLGFAVYAGVKVLSTICDIAKIAAQAKL